ncbi:MAG: glycosyltransferase [Bacteroidetes bacterium HGW-Bacteroidetes-21]|jgi:dolichol-phosphate mannosyltransferase|nr:MAG: glycosyltransferase [Bacteroidetes bacterium HGW-Bacteroidetes-21]
MITISIVVPVYKSAGSILPLYSRLSDSLDSRNLSFELIFVYDGGPAEDWQAIQEVCSKDKRVIGAELSRNFGQHKAITAGLSLTQGEWVVVMDCDLQDKPEDIIRLYDEAQSKGVEIVYARRVFRNDSFFKKLFSKTFYKVLEYLTDTKQNPEIGNYGIYHKKVIQAVLSMKDSIRYFPTMVRWVGFKTSYVEVVHEKREHGQTSYSIKKLISLALDVMLAFSDKPLRMTVKLGLLISAGSILFTIITLIRYFLGHIEQLGYASIIISIWFLFGLTIFIVGFVGLYVGKIFEQVKERPTFIIRQIINKQQE